MISLGKYYLIDNKELMKEWDYDKNGNLDPSRISFGSHKKPWWKCSKCKKSYQTYVYNRTSGHGCPYCAGHTLNVGKNDILTLYPDILKEWDYDKNGNPNQYSSKSHKKVWWKCSVCGYEWQAVVKNRTANNTKCPQCTKSYHTSFPEQAIYYYLTQVYEDIINEDLSYGVELDVFIPSMKIAIEYDGDAWHNSISSIQRDTRKNDVCYKNKIHLYRLREPNLPIMKESKYLTIINLKNKTKESQNEAIKLLFNKININVDVDITRDSIKILELYQTNQKANSLEELFPLIAKEWDYDKNGNIKPNMVFKGTTQKYWWKCSNGHSWSATVGSRTQNHGCPYCSGRFAISGENDLETMYPKLAKEWNYAKNKGMLPSNVKAQSNKKVWWVCKNNHEWVAPIYARVNGNGCPYCSNKKLMVGYNDLLTTNPELAKEWIAEKNTINPSQLIGGSHYKAWWKCSVCGYEWQSQVYSRVQGHGCPKCSKKRLK